MVANEDAAQKAPSLIERFVRQLIVASKAVMLYPPSSEMPRQNASQAVAALSEALEEFPEVTLMVTKQGLFFQDLPILPKQSAFTAFAQELYNRRLALVRFHSGGSVDDVISFLTVLKSSPEEVRAAGGYESLMWDQGVGAITVVETQVTLVDQTAAVQEALAEAGQDAVQATPAAKRSDVPRSREHVELTRLMGDERAVAAYLTQPFDSEGQPATAASLHRRFAELANMAAEHAAPDSDNLVRMFAHALWALDPKLRNELLEDQILPEARAADSLGSVVRRIDLEQIMRMLAEGEESFDSRRVGFTRALKNLVQITHVDRGEVAGLATQVMAEAGASPQTIHEVVEEAVPRKLTVRRAPLPARSLDSASSLALELIDHTPLSATADATDDPEVAELQRQAQVGVTEGDIIAALVAIAGLESREKEFANTMSVLEDSLDVLVTRGEIETAAEAAMTLVDAARNPDLTPAQHRRLEKAIARFARPEDIRSITHALRIYEPGQPEHEAAERLLATLGVLAIRPLLEQLAEEQDRAERKSLVDLLSKEAAMYVPELATHVSDGRWYFVRNVVSILGSTKSPAALAAFERTIRHNDARVRRETIRAVSMVQDRTAIEVLIAALGDDEGQNVQLAARYLGVRNVRHAVPALELVAKGEGRGNRESGPRVEAIEALGALGAVEALPTLQGLARRRIIGGSRAREIRTAAAAAITTIQAKAKGGGR